MNKPTSREHGNDAEKQACDYLQRHALELITRNFQCKLGEIDLIMRDEDSLVFVEVRLRNNKNYGSGADTVSYQKQRRLRNTANLYLQSNYGNRFPACRFDVISMRSTPQETHFEWIKNAF